MSFIDFYFYPAVVILFLLLSFIQFICVKNKKLSNTLSKGILLIFSFFVMGLYDWRFCLCILFVIVVTYIAALGIEGSNGKKRSWMMSLTVAVLIGVLGVFKYLNFFMSSAAFLTGHSWNSLSIILPIGISFYIFSAISYVLDVSWKTMDAERSLLNVAMFLSFFPKQICGPIVKGREFLPQLRENRRITLKT